ncbi:MAG: folate-binding protein YgfZ [Magnetococcales bacterium]|nr:folate-binding protein YgfZ [Magnetococcales bacterium]
MSLLKEHLNQRVEWTEDRGAATPSTFPDSGEEAMACAVGTALIDLSHGGTIAVSGEEAATFLGGLVTNQIKDVTAERCIYSAMLTPQGRFLWDFTVVERDGGFLLHSEPDRMEPLLQMLTMYKLRSKVDLTNASSTIGVLAIAGPTAGVTLAKAFPELAESLEAAESGSVFSPTMDAASDDGEAGARLWRDPRHDAFGWRLSASVDALPHLWDRIEAAGAVATGFSHWEHHRIAACLPRGGAEFIPDVSIPLESGLLEMNGVSFSKGCYVGQETTARTHHRGTIKKRLFAIEAQEVPEGTEGLAVGAPVTVGESKEAGKVTSLLCREGGCMGLGILRVSDVESEKPLSLAGVPMTANKPAWASW